MNSLSDNTLRHFAWRYTHFPIEDNATPRFHYEMVDHYLTSLEYIKPVEAFRGSAKTTNTCYMALWAIEEERSRYTLIVSDTATQSESILADISSLLADSSLGWEIVRDVVGELQIRRNGIDHYIVAKGAGASLRGIKRGRKRPDLIIIDDLLNDLLVMNSLRIDRLTRWTYRALLPSLDPNGEVYIVGTPMSTQDVFHKLCKKYGAIKIPIISDDKPMWNDRFDAKWIADKKQEYIDMGMLSAWKQEYELILSDPENRVFDMKKVHYEDEFPDELTYYITVDGAFSEKETADYSVITVLGVDQNMRWYVESHAMRANPMQVADKLMELVSKYSVDFVGIEKGAWSLAVGSYLEEQMINYQVWFTVSDLNTAGSKLSRIKALSSVVNTGRLTVIDDGDAEMLVEQMELTTHEGIMGHDDSIDSLAQMLQMDTQWYPQGGNWNRPTRPNTYS